MVCTTNFAIVLYFRSISGNKCDLEYRRDVDYKRAKRFANKNCLIFTEASAKTAFNVTPLFYAISKELLKINLKQEEKGFRVFDSTDYRNKNILLKRSLCC